MKKRLKQCANKNRTSFREKCFSECKHFDAISYTNMIHLIDCVKKMFTLSLICP